MAKNVPDEDLLAEIDELKRQITKLKIENRKKEIEIDKLNTRLSLMRAWMNMLKEKAKKVRPSWFSRGVRDLRKEINKQDYIEVFNSRD